MQAFFTSLIGYFLVKVTPKWGLLLLSTFVVYLTPLIYIKNKEFIDAHLNNAAEIANKQTEQLRKVAAQNTNKAFEATSSATHQYVSLAQDYIGGAKKTAVDKGYVSKETADKAPGAPVAPVEKNYTAPVEQPSSPVASTEQASSPVTSHSGPDFPAAPVDNVSSPIKTPEKTEFPAAPTEEPHHAQEPHVVSGPEPVPAVPSALTEHTEGTEEKKEPLVAL